MKVSQREVNQYWYNVPAAIENSLDSMASLTSLGRKIETVQDPLLCERSSLVVGGLGVWCEVVFESLQCEVGCLVDFVAEATFGFDFFDVKSNVASTRGVIDQSEPSAHLCRIPRCLSGKPTFWYASRSLDLRGVQVATHQRLVQILQT